MMSLMNTLFVWRENALVAQRIERMRRPPMKQRRPKPVYAPPLLRWTLDTHRLDEVTS